MNETHVPPDPMCPACKKDTPIFLHQPRGLEIVPCMPDLSGQRIIQTTQEVEMAQLDREIYLCLACGITFRRIFKWEIGKGKAQITQQPQQQVK